MKHVIKTGVMTCRGRGWVVMCSPPPTHRQTRSLTVFQEPVLHLGVEGRASPQGFPFYLPMGSPPRAYTFPSSVFVSPNREKQVSPEPSVDGQLACRWMKVSEINGNVVKDKRTHLNQIKNIHLSVTVLETEPMSNQGITTITAG